MKQRACIEKGRYENICSFHVQRLNKLTPLLPAHPQNIPIRGWSSLTIPRITKADLYRRESRMLVE